MAEERDDEKEDREDEKHESETYEGEDESGGEAATPEAGMMESSDPGQGEAMPPAGHDEWLANFHYALQTDPTLYGLAQLYEHMMSGQEEADPAAAEQAATQEALSGGVTEAPLPEGEQKPEEAVAMQNSETSVTYAEAFQQVASAIGSLRSEVASLKTDRAKKDAELSRLSAKAAEKDTDILIYQLESAGVKALGDPKKKEEIRRHFLSIGENDRAAKASEMLAYWDKDEAVQYAAKGAPVGEFIHVTDKKVNGGKPPKFGEAELRKATEYMKKNPKATWDECKTYAMNGEAVVNN
jgi:hypothetical protein